MTTVGDLVIWLESFAPSRLAEPWDNVGLLMGDPSTEVHRVMTCLTVTPRSAGEAIAERVGAIVSHHPVLFKPTKHLRADRPETSDLWRLARSGVAILSPHTAFDNTRDGINDGLAARIGLVEVGPLRPSPPTTQHKVVVFTSQGDRDAVRSAAFEAGAGQVGNYRECSFGSAGFGTFLAVEGANPTVGEVGVREVVREWRLEFDCPTNHLPAVLWAIRSNHSYESPAIDVYPTTSDVPSGPGTGRVGRLAHPESLKRFAARVARLFRAPATQYVGDPDQLVARVALCCGAGDDFLPDAARSGADVLVTGEARFHRALEAEALGLGLVVLGHHATERPGVEDLASRVARAFPKLTVWPSRAETDPLKLAITSASG